MNAQTSAHGQENKFRDVSQSRNADAHVRRVRDTKRIDRSIAVTFSKGWQAIESSGIAVANDTARNRRPVEATEGHARRVVQILD